MCGRECRREALFRADGVGKVKVRFAADEVAFRLIPVKAPVKRAEALSVVLFGGNAGPVGTSALGDVVTVMAADEGRHFLLLFRVLRGF